MFTLVCAIIPAAGLIPSALAQEDITSLAEEDLARGIVSAILDGGDDDEGNDDAADSEIVDEGSMDAATENPNQDLIVDQTDFNEFGDNTATNLDTDQTESTVAVSIDVDEEEDRADHAVDGVVREVPHLRPEVVTDQIRQAEGREKFVGRGFRRGGRHSNMLVRPGALSKRRRHPLRILPQ